MKKLLAIKKNNKIICRPIDSVVRVYKEGYEVFSNGFKGKKHIRKKEAWVMGAYNIKLDNYYIVDEATAKEIFAINQKIEDLQTVMQAVINNNFKNYRKAEISDFNKEIVFDQYTYEEARKIKRV